MMYVYAAAAHKCCTFSNFIEYWQSSIARLTFATSTFFNEINFCMVVKCSFMKLAFYTDLMCANLYRFRVSFSSPPYCILYRNDEMLFCSLIYAILDQLARFITSRHPLHHVRSCSVVKVNIPIKP